ncbi:hypothetical protein J6590_027035 [Homalodisca vitripennis]|nr:hypothetical protein J6590_027035 [Homalodisca vitripennis]
MFFCLKRYPHAVCRGRFVYISPQYNWTAKLNCFYNASPSVLELWSLKHVLSLEPLPKSQMANFKCRLQRLEAYSCGAESGGYQPQEQKFGKPEIEPYCRICTYQKSD